MGVKTLRRARGWLLFVLVVGLPWVVHPAVTSYPYVKGVVAAWLGSALLGLSAWELSLRGRSRLCLNWCHVFPWTLVIVMMGVAWAWGGSSSTGLRTLGGTVGFALLAAVVARTIRTARQAIGILTGMIASGTLLAAYALAQFAGVLPGPEGAVGSEAMIATLGNANYVAAYLAALFPIGLVLVASTRGAAPRWMGRIALGMWLLALITTASWGAWLAATVGGSLAVVGLRRTRVGGKEEPGLSSKLPGSRSFVSVGIAAGLVLILGLGLLTLAFGPGRDKASGWLAAAFPDPSTLRSLQLRVWNDLTALAMWGDHPGLGVGLGGYATRFLEYKAKLLKAGWASRLGVDYYIPRSEHAHNEYLQLLTETGLLGLGMLGWAAFLWARGLRRGVRRGRRPPVQVWGLWGGLGALSVAAFFDFPFHRPETGMLLGVYLGLLSGRALGYSCGVDRLRPLQVHLGGKARAALLLGSTLVVAGVWVLAYRDLRANVLLESAQQDLALARWERAEVKLLRALPLALDPVPLQVALGSLYEARGDAARAVRFLEMGLQGGVPDEVLYLRLARAYASLGQDGEAWVYVKQLLATEPHPVHKVSAYLLRAELWRRSGAYVRALEQLEHILRQHPNAIEAYLLAGEIYQEVGDRLSAIRTYRQGLERARVLLKEKRAKFAEEQASLSGMPFERWLQLLGEIRGLEAMMARIRQALDALKTEALSQPGKP